MSGESNEALLQRIFKEEEDYMIVLSIRDELMENVFEECHKNYMKNQTVKFIVQCAYDAMIKYLSFEFYYHPEVPDVKQSIWVPDKPIETSPKDTWAAEAVPVQPKEQETEIEPVESEVETEKKEGSGHKKASILSKAISTRSVQGFEPKCSACLGHPCTCLVTAEISCKIFDGLLDKAHSIKVKSTTKLSKHSLVGEKRLSDTANKSISKKSNIKKADVSQSLSLISPAKSEILEKPTVVLSEILEKPKVAPPKSKEKLPSKEIHDTEYLEDLFKSAKASTVRLPAIRVQSTLQFKPISQQSKKEK